MLYFYFLAGLKWLTNKIFRSNAQIATRSILGSIGSIVIILLARNLQDWHSPIREQMTDLSLGTSWLAENAPADAIVMVNEPVPAYVHVQRKTINFPKNNQELEAYLQNQGIEYIVIAPLLQSPKSTELSKDVKEIQASIESLPDTFELVFEDTENNVKVYQYMAQ
jgi:hypothetical protein